VCWQVANLFARDEMDEILGSLAAPMKKEFPKRPPSNENLKEYYLYRVRKNLHVALCFSPVSLLFCCFVLFCWLFLFSHQFGLTILQITSRSTIYKKKSTCRPVH
jgi:hypothetical protein